MASPRLALGKAVQPFEHQGEVVAQGPMAAGDEQRLTAEAQGCGVILALQGLEGLLVERQCLVGGSCGCQYSKGQGL
jgi:hypothetical protein